MKLGLVAALRREIEPTLQALRPSGTIESVGRPGPRVGDYPPYLISSGGIGVPRAERAARTLADQVQGLLSVGFCGALDDTLAPGDLVVGGTRLFEASPVLLELAQKTGPHRTGRIETTDHVVVDAEEKRSLARTTSAMVVEMEADGVGRVARERGLPFLCVKVVLDTPSHPLASAYSGVGRVMLDLLRRPWIVARMLDDGKRARLAADRLKEFFVALAKEISL